MKKLLIFTIASTFFLSSCMVNRHTIGDGPVGKKGATERYSKGKQTYLFWGGIALGNSHPSTPSNGNYQIKTSFNFWDSFVTSLTGGIFSMRTVRVLVKPDGGAEVPLKKEDATADIE